MGGADVLFRVSFRVTSAQDAGDSASARRGYWLPAKLCLEYRTGIRSHRHSAAGTRTPTLELASHLAKIHVMIGRAMALPLRVGASTCQRLEANPR
jgi:hypothetical protein